jgi:hypothetical protein
MLVRLVRPRAEVAEKLQAQIAKGNALAPDPDASSFMSWYKYTDRLLETLYRNPAAATGFRVPTTMHWATLTPAQLLNGRISALQSLVECLELAEEPSTTPDAHALAGVPAVPIAAAPAPPIDWDNFPIMAYLKHAPPRFWLWAIGAVLTCSLALFSAGVFAGQTPFVRELLRGLGWWHD